MKFKIKQEYIPFAILCTEAVLLIMFGVLFFRPR